MMTKDELIKAMGVQNMEPEMQKELILILSENVIKAVTLEVLITLKKEDREEFQNIAMNEDEQKLLYFFKEKVPELDTIVKNKTNEQIEAVKKSAIGVI